MNQFQVHWLLESCAHNDTKGLGKVTELTYVSLHSAFCLTLNSL